MKPISRFLVPVELRLPFVPLGIDLDAALEILSRNGSEVVEERDAEHSFKAQMGEAAVAIYTRGTHVDSAWYDDPLGRWTVRGKEKKIELHLARYASLPGWSIWNENGWMKYWKHETAQVRMVYGIHMDVIRFNRHE